MCFITKTYVNRRIWTLHRNSTFWEDRFRNGYEHFKENFRVTPETFKILVERLKGLEKQDSSFRKAIPLEKRIGIALYALGSSAEYRSIGNLFGVGRTTVGEIVLEFCHEVQSVLQKDYLNFYLSLDTKKLLQCIEGFEKLGFPQCCGAIDGCHIEVSPPQEDAYDYFNFKGWHSILLLAIVDFRCVM